MNLFIHYPRHAFSWKALEPTILTFTQPFDPAHPPTAENFRLDSYTYRYHAKYGSPEINAQPVTISAVELEPSGLSVRLICRGLRAGYVHELTTTGLASRTRVPLWHTRAYYTLNRIPHESDR